MDRPIVYTGAIPQDTDLLSLARFAMEGQGWQGQGVLGTGPFLTDFTCIPQSAPNLSVQITPGQILQLMNLDSTAYSDLAAVTGQQILKQGLYRTTGTVGCPAPTTSGFSINYLIEIAYSDVDGGSEVLPYYNASNPAVALSGPANTGTSQNTVRQGVCTVQAKAGTAATTGTQTTPAPDSGFVGAFVVTVAQGQTQILSGNISAYSPSSFFMKLPALPLWVQGGSWAFASDTGSANTIAITLNPQPTAPPASILVKKIASANTAAMNITIAGLGTYAVINADTTALAAAEVAASYMMHLAFDGTSYRLANFPGSTAVGSLTANAGEGITVNGSAAVALNFPGLTTETVVAANDLWSFYSQADTHHRTMPWSNLVSKLSIALGLGGAATVDGNMVVANFGGPPANSVGLNGDYAFDISSGSVYGPKTSGSWSGAPAFSPPNPYTTTGVGALINIYLGITGAGNANGLIGITGTLQVGTQGSATNVVQVGSGFPGITNVNAQDARWATAGSIPGVWKLINAQAPSLAGDLYGQLLRVS